jgi:hypothetical protein
MSIWVNGPVGFCRASRMTALKLGSGTKTSCPGLDIAKLTREIKIRKRERLRPKKMNRPDSFRKRLTLTTATSLGNGWTGAKDIGFIGPNCMGRTGITMGLPARDRNVSRAFCAATKEKIKHETA